MQFRHFKTGEAIPMVQHIFPINEKGSDKPLALATISRNITERKEAEKQLLAVKDELAAELAAMIRLHELSTRLLANTELQTLLEEVLDATIALQNADFGNIQLHNPKTKALEIVAQRGFKQEFLDHFSVVTEESAACGRAMQNKERVIIEDIQTDVDFKRHRKIAASAGFRSVQSTPLFSHAGEPLGMISTHFRQPHRPSENELRLTDLYARQATEVIERKQAEEILRESEQKFSVIYDKAAFAIALAKLPEGVIVNVNEAWEKLFGFTKAEALGKTSVELGINRGPGGRASFFDEIQTRGSVRNHELTFFTKSGNGRLISCNADVVALGRERYLLSTMHDITELRQAEESLRASEERFRSYFELGLIGMAITSPTKGIVEVNDQLCGILGYERSELLQMSWADLTHPDDLAADVNNFNEVMAGKSDGYSIEKRWIRKDGQVVDTIMAAKCLRREDGSVDYFVGLVQDITERKRAEGALHRTQAELAHVTRVTTLGELTASIAHEINQPLGAIVTNGNACLRLLLRDEPDLKRIQEAVECIISDAGRASEVIKRIRVPLKKADTEKVLLKINEVIRETIALVHSELNKNHVLLRTDLEADMPLIKGDKIQLQQVLLNLILNANEAMNDAESPRELVISSQHIRPYEITVELKDTGTGIAPQNCERIFDAFFTTKHKGGGLGLGLSISRTIIEAHGGWLWATANEGKGAAFKFTVLTIGESQQ